MKDNSSIKQVKGYLSGRIAEALENSLSYIDGQITEIRLNIGRPVAVICPDRVMYLTKNSFTASSHNIAAIICTRDDIDKTVDAVTHYSFHSHISELQQGYFIIENGVRVGISGMYNSDGLISVITGLNFRISRSVAGCCEEILPYIADTNSGLLICGGVNSGKTTLLRDLCRCIGDRKKVALVDERNEIACTSDGDIHYDVGSLTNVLSGCERHKGIVAAIRSLSPDFIICDEIATDEDTEALLRGAGCGVNFCATIHAKSYGELLKRPFTQRLLSTGIFSHAVFLSGSSRPGKIAEIRRLDNAC